MGFELAFPLLVFWPGSSGWPRTLALTAGVLLHLGIALTLAIPFFSAVMPLTYLLFLYPDWLGGLAKQMSLPWTRQVEHPARPYEQRIISVMRATLLTGMMGLVLWHNASGTPVAGRMLAGPMTAAPRAVLEASGLWQNWGLFAPRPTESYGWLLVLGTDQDRQEIDLRTGQRPADYSPALYRVVDMRWRKYDEWLAAAPERLTPAVQALADAACRGKLRAGQVYQDVEVWRVTLMPSPEATSPVEQRTLLTEQLCVSP
ncbi:MAG: hypothetical protein IT326_04670 [Anaerolineae bacterium]|nr:hypothetical protein [Anaerolineae bacterium]